MKENGRDAVDVAAATFMTSYSMVGNTLEKDT
jgi:hypothetical protein